MKFFNILHIFKKNLLLFFLNALSSFGHIACMHTHARTHTHTHTPFSLKMGTKHFCKLRKINLCHGVGLLFDAASPQNAVR